MQNLSVPTKAVTMVEKTKEIEIMKELSKPASPRVPTPPQVVVAAPVVVPAPKPAPAPKKDEQVSKLKFEIKDDIIKRPPILFDQDCQTDQHMLEAWLAKKTLDNEVGTDPIKFERDVNNNSTMVQTEPDLDGIYRERDEPVPFVVPEGEFDKPGVQILKYPLPEMRLI